jgi:serine/threonine protein phosphatase 1
VRTLAIGDIHGASAALDALLAAVKPTADDRLIFLGDYVSRGPDSRGVLDRLIQLKATHKPIFLRGNHEVMMLEARDSPSDLKSWRSVGGREALDSYSSQLGRPGELADVPVEHWEFLAQDLLPYFETETHIFVHANLYAGWPLAEQPDLMLYWEFLNGPVRHESGRIMVCGHTTMPNGRPGAWPTTIALDTGAYKGGWLTCLHAELNEYWQADVLGNIRRDTIDPDD